MARHMWYRVIVNGDTLLKTVSVSVSQQLEGGGPQVAQIDVAGPVSELLLPKQTIDVYQVNFGNGMVDDAWPMRQIFSGEIDEISASSWPRAVRLACVGQLSKLDRVRISDVYYNPVTDIDMAKEIFDYCNIDYDDADIDGWGMDLTLQVPLVWRAGQSGRELLQEIDSITGCATIEMGSGKPYRMQWYPWGKRYSDLVASGDELAKVRTFRRGQNGIMFYANERERGGVAQVKTYFKITGYSWTDTDGCNYQITGEGHDPIGVLGAGIYTGSEEISSEFIQDPQQAADIAYRNLQWYNRYPDTVKIRCGNDHRLTVGDIIAVIDDAWGIDLALDNDPYCYRITATERDGDFMVIDAIGGPVGNTDGAEIRGQVLHCCGTQNDDGTCTETDPADPTPPGGGPDVPGLPDGPVLPCDPITDPTCIPEEVPEVSEPIDPSEPYIECIETISLPNGEGFLDGTCLGTPPANPCFNKHYAGKTQTFGSLGTTGYDCDCEIAWNWRGEGSQEQGYYEVDSEGVVQSVRGSNTTIDWYLSTEVDKALQDEDSDVVYGPGSFIYITCTVNFQHGGTLRFGLLNFGDSLNGPAISFRGGSPYTTSDIGGIPTCDFGWQVDGMSGLMNVNYCSTPRNSFANVFHQNSGQLGGTYAELNTDYNIAMAFDLTGTLFRVTAYGDMGEGYAESKPGSGDGPDVDSYNLQMTLNTFTPFTPASVDDWGVKVTNLVIHDTTCEPNPFYPGADPGDDI